MESDPEALLARVDWVRRLAGGLAARSADADDLAQDTLLAALARPPRVGVPPARWLAAVARNLARSKERRRGRRSGLERRAARPEGTDLEPGRALEQLEAHRRLVDAVAALGEPLRQAILWRYFDDLAPRDIAQRTGLPVRTVHTRLHRALTRLRRSLERGDGPPLAAWLPLLVPGGRRPLASAPALASTSTLLGGLFVGTKTQLLAAAALCSGLFLAWRALAGAPPPIPTSPRTEAAVPHFHPPLPATTGGSGEVIPAGPARSASPPTPRIAAAEARPVSTSTPARGRVIDLEGRPVPGVAIGFLHPDAGHPEPGSPPADGAVRARAVSGADGRFELAAEGAEALGPADGGNDPAPRFGHVVLLDAAWMAVFEPLASRSFAPGTEEELLVVVAPSVRLAGRVVDELGAGIGGAELVVAAQYGAIGRRGIFPALPEAVETLRLALPQARSRDDGGFELQTYTSPRAFLRVSAAGFASGSRAVPAASTGDLAIVLERPGRGPGQLVGTVVDSAGAPVEGARVALAYEHARTDGEGRFVLPLTPQSSADPTLSALKEGCLPAILERRGPDPTAANAWPDPLVLALGGAPLELLGRVLDAAGEPARGIEIQLAGATDFGPVEVPGQPFLSSPAAVEDLLGGRIPGAEPRRTDEDGRFAVGGLLPRAYGLRAIDWKRCRSEEFGPFEAGSRGLVLRLAPVRVIPRVAGRVVDLFGEPLEGLSVSPLAPIRGGEPSPEDPLDWLHGPPVECGPDGRFAFEELSVSATHLQFSGEAIGFSEPLEIPPGADPEQLEFRVPRRCRLRVALGPEAGAPGRFELQSADGRPVPMFRTEGEFAYSTLSAEIDSTGASGTYSAPETAVLCVIRLHGGRTFERRIRLDPAGLTSIGP